MKSRRRFASGGDRHRRSDCGAPGIAAPRDAGVGEMDRFDLGSHTRTISTAAPEAQRWFDLGLNWCFAFNRSEGVKCFAKALEYDPECVMAHWGIAYGCGPFYNMTWRDHSAEEADIAASTACEHIQKARALTHRAT